MKNHTKCLDELTIALAKAKHVRPERLFSVGRSCIPTLEDTESMLDIVAGIGYPSILFGNMNLHYLSGLSTDDELAFFDTHPEEVEINGQKHIAEYAYDEINGRIIVTII